SSLIENSVHRCEGNLFGHGGCGNVAVHEIEVIVQYVKVATLVVRPGIGVLILMNIRIVNIHCSDDCWTKLPQQEDVVKNCVPVCSARCEGGFQAILVVGATESPAFVLGPCGAQIIAADIHRDHV